MVTSSLVSPFKTVPIDEFCCVHLHVMFCRRKNPLYLKCRYLNPNFLGLTNLHYSYGNKMLCNEKNPPKFQNVIGNLWLSGGRSHVMRWLCVHMTVRARLRCCCSLNSSSQEVWLLPHEYDSPACQGASVPWVVLEIASVPETGSPPESEHTDGNGCSTWLWFCVFQDQGPWLCLGVLVSVLDLLLVFLYSGSIIIVVTWPQIQWHPSDPAAGLQKLQVQIPFTSLWHF